MPGKSGGRGIFGRFSGGRGCSPVIPVLWLYICLIRKEKLTTFFGFVCQNNFFSLLLINFLGFTQSYAALVREEEYSSMVSKNDNMVNTNKVLADLKNIMTKKEGKYIDLNLGFAL